MIKNIGFDIDGVLYPWHTAVDTYLKAYCNIDAGIDLWKNPLKYISPQFADNLCRMEDLCTKFIPDKDMLDVLWKLSEKHNIYYITSRPDDVKTATEMYFQKYGFPQNYNLTFTKDKSFWVKYYEIDLFVEDRDKFALELKDITNVVLVRQPWNEELWSDFANIRHIGELPKLLEAYAERKDMPLLFGETY